MDASDVCESSPNNSYISENYWSLNSDYILYGRVTAAFFLLYALIGIPWNILVTITILWKKLYLQPTVMLLLDLAVDDMLLGLPMVIIAITGWAGEYVFGKSDLERCHVCSVGSIGVSLAMNSIFVIALMSVDRLLYIYKPMVYERKSIKYGMLISITSTAILSLLLGLLPLADPSLISFNKYFMSCLPRLASNWYSGLLISLSCVALVVIVTCNVWVVCIAHKNIQAIYAARQSINDDTYDKQMKKRMKKVCHRKHLHLFRVFGFLIFSNIISWMPKIVIFLIIQFRNMSDIPEDLFFVAQILFFAQIVIHPMLETCLLRDVLEPLKRLITCNILNKQQRTPLDSTDEKSCHHLCWAYLSNKKCVHCFHLLNASLIPHNFQSNTNTSSSQSQPSLDEKL